MPVTVIAEGTALFVLCLVFHVLAWRTLRVKKEILFLFLIFLAAPLCFFVWACLTGRLGFWEAAAAWEIDAAFSVVYLQAYPAFKRDIPTFQILMLVRDSGPQGMSLEEIMRKTRDEQIHFIQKIEEMHRDGLTARDGSKVRLTAAGIWLAELFIAYRCLLGLPVGSG